MKNNDTGSSSVSPPFDSVFRTMITDRSDLAISLINEMFGMQIDPKTQIVRFQDELFRTNAEKKVGDSFTKIESDRFTYHMECESPRHYDDKILFRLFEYDPSDCSYV